MHGFTKYIKSLLKELTRTEMKILPGNIAYFFVLSLIPTFMLIMAFSSLFSIPIDSVTEFVRNILPEEASGVIIDIITGKGINAGIGAFNLIALIVASNGTYSIIMASNLLYDVKKSDEIKDRIKSVILLFIILFLVIFLLLVPVFGDQILTFLKETLGISSVIDKIIVIFNILKWPITMFIVYFNIKLIYTMAPSVKIPSKYNTYGAFLTTCLWSIVTYVFSYYLNNFANYNAIYGNLSSIIVLMVWLYFLSYVFVFGIAINSTRYKNKELDNNKT